MHRKKMAPLINICNQQLIAMLFRHFNVRRINVAPRVMAIWIESFLISCQRARTAPILHDLSCGEGHDGEKIGIRLMMYWGLLHTIFHLNESHAGQRNEPALW